MSAHTPLLSADNPNLEDFPKVEPRSNRISKSNALIHKWSWAQIVATSLGICILGLLTSVMIIWMKISKDSSSQSLSMCYAAPSCPFPNDVAYDKTTGFTNDTGWSSSIRLSDQCCQICLENTKTVTCFDDSDPTCLNKTGLGDYDYLMMDQIWLPQLCAAFKEGHDPTLTHLAGSTCFAEYDKFSDSLLSIHGLWPNYFNGYPQCCHSDSPLVPAHVAEWEIWPALKTQWIDPSVSSDNDCSTCYMLNHEWQKHGSCFSSGASETEQQNYFESALLIANTLSIYSDQVSSKVGEKILTSSLASMYPVEVNIICDPQDTTGDPDVGYFSEVQTCWSVATTKSISSISLSLPSGVSLTMTDCVPAKRAVFTTPCPLYALVRSP